MIKVVEKIIHTILELINVKIERLKNKFLEELSVILSVTIWVSILLIFWLFCTLFFQYFSGIFIK